MQILVWDKLDAAARREALRRPKSDTRRELSSTVSKILSDVRAEGDAAVGRYTRSFDGVDLTNFEIDRGQITREVDLLDGEIREALDVAKLTIERFHSPQSVPNYSIETMPGIYCRQIRRPLNRVGLYVPGGSAPLLSSVLMQAIPARIAGCREIILVTPPPVHPAILAAAGICGIETVFQIGGAQAIAAMGYGTESISRVDKIFGPGNAFVTEAKRQIDADPTTATTIDMLAGPSELLVIGDDSANPPTVAADLISQAEHGSDSQVIMVTNYGEIAEAVSAEFDRQLHDLPRAPTVREALSDCRIIVTDSIETSIRVANQYAAEHLSIQTRDPDFVLSLIDNAGSIFLGPWSPVAAGDYASGTNHVLPTGATAINQSGLTVASFQKTISVQELSGEGLQSIRPAIETLARVEGLEGHARAVAQRFKENEVVS